MPTQKNLQIKENDKTYEAFLRSLRLIGLALKSCSAAVDREAFFELSKDRKKSVRKFLDDYKLTAAGDEFFEAEGHFELTVSAPPKESPTALRMNFVFEVHMHGAVPIWQEGAERFVKSELRLILVPYARQFITSMNGQMAIPPVVIPLAPGRG